MLGESYLTPITSVITNTLPLSSRLVFFGLARWHPVEEDETSSAMVIDEDYRGGCVAENRDDTAGRDVPYEARPGAHRR